MPDVIPDDKVEGLWERLREHVPVRRRRDQIARKASQRVRKKALDPWIALRWRREN